MCTSSEQIRRFCSISSIRAQLEQHTIWLGTNRPQPIQPKVKSARFWGNKTQFYCYPNFYYSNNHFHNGTNLIVLLLIVSSFSTLFVKITKLLHFNSLLASINDLVSRSNVFISVIS